jgi:hypothetical protein
MYDLLEHAFLSKVVRVSSLLPSSLLMKGQGVTKFVQLADDSSQVPKLQNKSYADYRLTPTKWIKLGLLHQILKVSSSCDLTVGF